MYTAAEYRQIRQTCMKDLRTLLSYLGIEMPDFEDGDEYDIYEELDGEINDAICDLLKTDSVVEGYINLLNFGGIQFSFDESEAELLDKIIANRNRILRGIENYSLSHHDDDDDEDEDEEDDDEDDDDEEDDDDDDDDDEEEEEKPYDGRKRFFQNFYLVIGGVVSLVFAIGFLILGGGDFFAVLLTLGGIVLVGFGAQGLVGTDVNARLDSMPVQKTTKPVSKNDSFMSVMEFNQMFKTLQILQRINSQI